MTGTAVTQSSSTPTTLGQLLQKQRPAIEAALPRHMSADRLLRIALTEVRKNPDLVRCEPMSFLGAVVQSAQLGLEPGVLGHAYLVPFNNRQTGRREVQLIVGYKGLIDLARRSGQISSITAHAVYEGDDFEYVLGLQEKLNHVPKPGRVAQARHLVAVYAIAKLRDGGHQLEVMSREEVEAIRKRSKASDSGPWKTDYEEMAKKTVLRRLCKMLPASIELHKAVALDETAASGETQRNELTFDDFTEATVSGGAATPALDDLNARFTEAAAN